MLGLQVAQGHLTVDLVVIAPSDPRARDVSLHHQVGDDPLDRSFRYPNALSNVGDPDARVLGDAQQDHEVTGDERPPTIRATLPATRHADMLASSSTGVTIS